MMYSDDKPNDCIFYETSLQADKNDGTLEKINNICMDISYSDSNYVSEDSTVCSEGIIDVKDEEEKSISPVFNEFNVEYHDDIEKKIGIYNFEELMVLDEMDTTGYAWLLALPHDLYETDLNLNFKTMKLNVEITDVHNLLTKLQVIRSNDFDNFINISPIQIGKRKHMVTSTPFSHKVEPISRKPNNTFVFNKGDGVNDVSNNGTILNNCPNQTYIKVFSPIKSLSNSYDVNENDVKCDRIYEANKNSIPIINSVDLVLPSHDNSSAKLPIPFNPKNRFSMIQAYAKDFIPVQSASNSFEKNKSDEECSVLDNTLTKGIPCDNLSVIDLPPSISENTVIKRQVPINSKHRLSLIQTTVRLRQPETNFIDKKSSLENQNNPKSVVIKPKEVIKAPIKLIRNSMAPMPQPSEPVKIFTKQFDPKSILNKPNGVIKAPTTSIRHSMAVIPQYSEPVKSDTQNPTKNIPPQFAKPQTMKPPSKIVISTQKNVNTILTSENQSQLLRPTQLKLQNKNPRMPKPSDTVPIVSPSIGGDDNPLSRTFDKNDFLLLKSVTNIDYETASNTVPYTADSNRGDSNNNNRTIYTLAQDEEANLISDIAIGNARQKSAAVRGLRIPSKIQSRVIPSLKRP